MSAAEQPCARHFSQVMMIGAGSGDGRDLVGRVDRAGHVGGGLRAEVDRAMVAVGHAPGRGDGLAAIAARLQAGIDAVAVVIGNDEGGDVLRRRRADGGEARAAAMARVRGVMDASGLEAGCSRAYRSAGTIAVRF